MSVAEDLILNALQIVEGEAIKRSGAGPAAAATAAAALTVLGKIATAALFGHSGGVSVAQARERIAKLIMELPGEIMAGDVAAEAYLQKVYAAKQAAEIAAAEKAAAERDAAEIAAKDAVAEEGAARVIAAGDAAKKEVI